MAPPRYAVCPQLFAWQRSCESVPFGAFGRWIVAPVESFAVVVVSAPGKPVK